MNNGRIAFVAEDVARQHWIRRDMEERGFSNSIYRFGQTAIDDLVSCEPMDLVVINPRIGPGIDYTDPGFRRIMEPAVKHPYLDRLGIKAQCLRNFLDRSVKPVQIEREDYFGIGLRVIERLREADSAQRDTPIAVISHYRSTGDNLVPDAEEKALAVGANIYFDMSGDFSFSRMCTEFEQLVKGKYNLHQIG